MHVLDSSQMQVHVGEAEIPGNFHILVQSWKR
jgi:hypothetical protein